MNFVLREGDSGQEVSRLQTALGNLSIDGKFGSSTEAAVQAYQNTNGLLVDGIVGPQTLGSLNIPVLKGIDLSRHNGTVDFSALAKSDCKFAWVKVTEGTTHVNPGFEDKFKGCRDNGIVVGAYHFSRPDTYSNDPSDARDEAEHFLDKLYSVGLNVGDLLPVLDLEAGLKTDDQYNIDWALEWLSVIESAESVRPIVYTAKWYYNSYMKRANKNSLNDLSAYPLWLASYNEGTSPNRPVPAWDSWSVWQWTSRGVMPGVKGSVDLNWMAGGQLGNLVVK